MNIIFMGTPEFAIPSLQILINHSYNISAVVTAPDKPRGRGQQVSFTPIKEFALSNKIHVLQPVDLKNPTFVNEIKEINPDLIVVVAFRILPKEVFTIPKYGSFNLHASLLPKYRGAAPINWAIINGETVTGVTTFFLQEKVDTGSIILQSKVEIGMDVTAGELYEKLAKVGAEVVLQTVQLIEQGKVETQTQNDEYASLAPKIFKNDCRINWNNSALSIHNFIRGLSPYPSAWTTHNGKVIKIFRSKIIYESVGQAGIIIDKTDSSLVVGTGTNNISILEIQQEGKKKLSIEEFLRGYAIKTGERFE